MSTRVDADASPLYLRSVFAISSAMGEAKRRRQYIANQPCRCPSGRPAGKCCFDGKRWHKPPSRIILRRPGDDGTLENCYLRSLGSCCDRLSREHLVSEAVLRVIGDILIVKGFPWTKDVEKRLTPDALVARCLCRAHNAALSDLDAAAARFFRAMANCRHGPPARHYTFSGHDLERWLLKTTLAFGVSTNFSYESDRKHPGHFTPDIDVPRLLQDHMSWPRHAGMYFSGRIGDKVRVHHNFTLSPLLHPETEAIAGVLVAMQGTNWSFIVDRGGTDAFAKDKTLHFRPAELVFRHPTVTHRVEFSWEDDHDHKPMVLTADEPLS